MGFDLFQKGLAAMSLNANEPNHWGGFRYLVPSLVSAGICQLRKHRCPAQGSWKCLRKQQAVRENDSHSRALSSSAGLTRPRLAKHTEIKWQIQRYRCTTHAEIISSGYLWSCAKI